jgi:hypothetical protein
MRRAVAALLAVAAFAATNVPSAAAPPEALSPDAMLARYRSTLEVLPALGDVVFQYSESRSGPARALEEEHRVYRRADGEERNETIAVNGSQVVPAIARFESRPTWPYDVRAFAVDAADYNVLALGRAFVGGKPSFGFSAVRATSGDFSVTGLFLDLTRALPLRETFAVTGGGCAGDGTIDFAPIGRYWLPSSASVSCTVAPAGGTFKESITFSDYAFPQSLPPDVFAGLPTPTP